ncbi:general substrate transporter [Ceraceosorus bombacis]|uniref:General substrate transporter n=1 Tax=Ceraceosorus bombacis TaxID=401625 RepID=A0A0P1BMN8_9BASI|nr:general substrate transporter [Ceraceosorus bombacis]
MAITFTVGGSPIGLTSISVALVASVGGFLFGYDTGQISGIQEMIDFKERFATETIFDSATMTTEPAFNSWLIGLIVSFLSIGTFFGVLIGAPIADKLGRRLAMTVETVVFSVGVLIQVTAQYAWYQVAIGRLVSGLGVGALSAAVPLYQSEAIPSQLRGAGVATYQLAITFGILVSNCINIGTRSIEGSWSWRTPILLGVAFAAVLGIGIWFLPESPRWLAARGRHDEAYGAVARVRGATREDSNPWVEAEYASIITYVQNEAKLKKAGWIDCFRPQNKTLYRTVLGIVLQAGQQLTGANYFFYYGANIFNSVGLRDSFVTQIILGAVNFVATFGSLYILERFGRRIPLMVGAIGMTVWLLIFGLAGHVGNPTDPTFGSLMIASACIFIVFYATTWAPGIWLFIGESFASETRAKQASLSAASNWFWNFLLAFFTKPITGDIDYAFGFVFAGANFLGFFIVYFFVYETKGLTLEEIDEMYNDDRVKPWQSRKWAPAGRANRLDIAARVRDEKTDDVLKVEDPQHGHWKSQPNSEGDETDTARKQREEPISKTEDA